MKKNLVLMVFLIVTVFALSGCGADESSATSGDNGATQELKYKGEILLVHSGAGLSGAMDEIGQAFENEYGATVNLNYAGCAQLLSQMEINKQGDVFVGASDNDMEIAMEKGFACDYLELVYHIPAIAVPAGNPAGITCLGDFGKPGVKLILGDEKTNAIGKKGAKIFEKNGLTESVASNVVTRDATVNEIVMHLAMKQGDAGLIWEDIGSGSEDIEVIAIPEEQNVIDKASACVLGFTENEALARSFVEYMHSETGVAIFVEHGFKEIE